MDLIKLWVAPHSEYFAGILIVALLAFFGAWSLYNDAVQKEGKSRDMVLGWLHRGGGPRGLYVDLMTALLDRVDKLFGDANTPQPWVARLLGLRTPRPCWTALSFDKLALLALAYPLVSLLGTWVFAGDVGPIGQLFGLSAPERWWERPALGTFVMVEIFILAYVLLVGGGERKALWLALAFHLATWSFVAFAMAGAFGITRTIAGLAFLSIPVAVAIAPRSVIRQRHLGVFWSLLWPIALGAIGLGFWAVSFQVVAGPISAALAILCLLPLINLPFDWLSIGATRALLRRGCENHGPLLLRSPTFLGLIDAFIGLILLFALGCALLLGLTAADAIMVHAGGNAEFHPIKLIAEIKADPTAWKHAWIYVTLLSTLLPSLCNLTIGVACLLTFSVPPLRRWLIKTIPNLHEPSWSIHRFWAVGVLSANWFVAIVAVGAGGWLLYQALLWFPRVAAWASWPLESFARLCHTLFHLPV